MKGRGSRYEKKHLNLRYSLKGKNKPSLSIVNARANTRHSKQRMYELTPVIPYSEVTSEIGNLLTEC